jgi:MFS-type transporter involved in bile tolerance (Atg22 family)
MGPLLFGTVSSAFGSQRPAILVISVFFVAGSIIIRYVHGGGPNIGRLDGTL